LFNTVYNENVPESDELKTFKKGVDKSLKKKFLSFCSIVKNIEWNGMIKIDD
jgi:hypothetical protein